MNKNICFFVFVLILFSGVFMTAIGAEKVGTTSFQFLLDQSKARARAVLFCSIIYLPAVLITMTWDYYRLLS